MQSGMDKPRTFRSQASGLAHLLSQNKPVFHVSPASTRTQTGLTTTRHSRTSAFSNPSRASSTLSRFKKKKLTVFSPVDHLQKFLQSQRQFGTKSIKSSSGKEYTIHEGGEKPQEPEESQDATLKEMYESSEPRALEGEGTVQTVSKALSEICEEEIDSLKQGAQFEESRWEEAQKWLEATDYAFIHQEENFAFLVLKEEGELPA